MTDVWTELSSDPDFVRLYEQFNQRGEEMNLSPTLDRLVVEVIEGENATSLGIIIPDSAQATPQRARVLAAGPGPRTPKGETVSMGLEPGDEILFSKFAGTEYKYQGRELLILRESEVLAKIIE